MMDPAHDYPRLLTIGQSPHRRSGGGITLSNLLEGWPADRLASIVPAPEPHEPGFCGHVYSLGRSEEVWRWPLSLVPRTQTPPSGPLANEDIPDTASTGSHHGPPKKDDGALRRSFNSFAGSLGIVDALRRLELSDGLAQWALDFRPDVVYAQFSNLPGMELILALLDVVDRPLVIHFMDDWPSTVYSSGLAGGVMRGRTRRTLQTLIGRSVGALCISDAMSQEYQSRYGMESTALHNPVDLELWDAAAGSHAATLPDMTQGFSIVYAGHVGNANRHSLAMVAKVVSDLAAQGSPARLHVFTRDRDVAELTQMASMPGVSVHPGVAYEAVPSLMGAADALLLPLDFDAASLRFARLSIPTKVSEYLASGRPVLAFVPAETAVAGYVRSAGWAQLVDAPDPAALSDAIRLLIEDEALRQRLTTTAREVAERRHAATSVRETFRDTLVRAARA